MATELQKLKWVYNDARARCRNVTHKAYHLYGGRGIQFKFNSFEEWLNYMGPRPKGYEQDRINNDGHYEVGNLRWADRSTQQKNKRVYKSNSSGLCGVNYINTENKWVARCNIDKNGKRKYLYVGEDFFEACCARLSWESNSGEIEVRNRRGNHIVRNSSTLGIRKVQGEIHHSGK